MLIAITTVKRILYLSGIPIFNMTLRILGKKQDSSRNHHHLYDDETIENMKQYFKIEHDSDALLKYIRGNRICHDGLAEP